MTPAQTAREAAERMHNKNLRPYNPAETASQTTLPRPMTLAAIEAVKKIIEPRLKWWRRLVSPAPKEEPHG